MQAANGDATRKIAPACRQEFACEVVSRLKSPMRQPRFHLSASSTPLMMSRYGQSLPGSEGFVVQSISDGPEVGK